VNVQRDRLVAFVLGAFFVGVAGALHAHFLGVAAALLTELLRHLDRGVDLGFPSIPWRPGLAEVGFAAVMLIILVFRPRGLTGGRKIQIPRFLRPSPAVAADRIHPRSP
jgi:branched-chain amino acid transport system permease protein